MTTIAKVMDIVAILKAAMPDCKPISVGGSVRDALLLGLNDVRMGFTKYQKDFDLEIFHATPDAVVEVLKANGVDIELVGRSFAVYKVKGYEIDISFPRTERKTGSSHTDFIASVDPNMSFEMAALRRDFTCNAIGYDWTTPHKDLCLLDPYFGAVHLAAGLLHPVSDKFKEDALRIMRAFKFIARYGFKVSDDVITYSQSMIEELALCSKERMAGEWNDFILKCAPGNVGKAINFLFISNAIELFPEIKKLKGVKQNSTHHPEGDVYNHTILCFEHYVKHVRAQLADDNEKLVVGYAVLTHDFGKANTTFEEDGKIKSPGHEDDPASRNFLERLFDKADQRLTDIEMLVRAHMRPVCLHSDTAGNPAIKRLNKAVKGRMDLLLSVVTCDQNGRGIREPNMNAIWWVQNKLAAMKIDPQMEIQPLIKGRHLIEHLGLAPGPAIGKIVDEMFEAQLDDKFSDEQTGVEYLKSHYQRA